MDGFKNSTRVQYMKGGSCEGYAKGGSVKGAAKINKVMGEFKRGELHSGSKSGPEVTSKKQATAIALSEARKAGAKIPVKKGNGGSVEAPDALMARMTPKELAMGRAGVEAAKARLAKRADPTGSARESDRATLSNAARNADPMGAVRESETAGTVRPLRVPRKPGVPVADRAPLISPSTMRDIRSRAKMEGVMGKNKGGLAAMPKGKKC